VDFEFRVMLRTPQAEQFAKKLKTPSFRGTLRAEESLFSWI